MQINHGNTSKLKKNPSEEFMMSRLNARKKKSINGKHRTEQNKTQHKILLKK